MSWGKSDKEALALRISTRLPLLLPLIAASCAGLGPNPYVQPQYVDGPCHVDSFFIVALSTTNTDMTASSSGEACVITMFNPDLQAVQDGALITERATHGQVWTRLLGADSIAQVFYRPFAGYVGPDRFNITFEPAARDVTFNVTVQPGGAPPG